MNVRFTEPDATGVFTISINTGADTSSLMINDEEQGGRADGRYEIRKVARVGQATNYQINAIDVNGNKDSKTITVSRKLSDSAPNYIRLNPANVKVQPSRDIVAIIVGIQNYKRIPKAEYASDDAQDFYDYAIRALGVKPENIKLLLDDGADEVRHVAQRIFNARNVQVACEGVLASGKKHDFGYLAGATCFGGQKCASYFISVL